MDKIYKNKIDKPTSIFISLVYLLGNLVVFYIGITQLVGYYKNIILSISIICLISNIYFSKNIFNDENYIYITIKNDKIEINRGMCKNKIIYKSQIQSIKKSEKTVTINLKNGEVSNIYLGNIKITEKSDFIKTISQYLD